jgi:hypothetical protein
VSVLSIHQSCRTFDQPEVYKKRFARSEAALVAEILVIAFYEVLTGLTLEMQVGREISDQLFWQWFRPFDFLKVIFRTHDELEMGCLGTNDSNCSG